MTAVALNQLNSATRRLLRDKEPKDIISRGDPLHWALWRKTTDAEGLTIDRFEEGFIQPDMAEKFQGGQYVMNFVTYALSNRGGRGPTTRMQAERKETMGEVRFPVGGAYASELLTLNDKRFNKGPAAIVKLTDQKIKLLMKSIQDVIATNLYLSRSAMVTYLNGLSEKRYYDEDVFDGLPNCFVTGNEWGTQTAANMAAWAANLYTSAVTLNYAGLNTLLNQARVSDAINGVPDYIVTSHDIATGYKNALQTQQNFEDKAMANAGFEFVMHDHRVHVVGSKKFTDHVGASNAYGLNLANLHLLTDPDTALPKPEWEMIDPLQRHTSFCFTEWDGSLVDDHRDSHVHANNVTAA